jgi:WD40 repeat protein
VGDYPPSYRDNDRRVHDDAALAATLFAELGPLLPARLSERDGSGWTLCGLNPRFRFCRYRDGQGFRIHQDGAHQPDAARRSLLTLQIYLDDDPERVGGQTRFYAGRGGGLLGGVAPRIGRVIVFEHRLWHDGEPVSRGEKHVLRTDVIYQRERTARTQVAGDAENPGPATVISGHQGYVFALAALPAGELASGSRDRTLRIFQTATGVQRACMTGHRGSVSALLPLCDSDGQPTSRIVSGGRDHALVLHDIQRGESARLTVLPAAVLCVADCGPALIAVGCADGGIYLFDRRALLDAAALPMGSDPDGSVAPAWGLPRCGSWVWALLALSGGRLLSAGDDGSLRLWDLDRRRPLATWALGHGAVHALSACADSDHPAGGSDGVVAGCGDGHLVWLSPGRGDTEHEGGLRPRSSHAAHRGEIYAVCAWGPGGILSAGEDGRVVHTRCVAGRLHPAQPVTLGSHPNFVRSLAVLGDGRVASAGYDGAIAIWPPPG